MLLGLRVFDLVTAAGTRRARRGAGAEDRGVLAGLACLAERALDPVVATAVVGAAAGARAAGPRTAAACVPAAAAFRAAPALGPDARAPASPAR